MLRFMHDGEEHDCNGHKQDPNEDPHLPKPPKPKDDDKEAGNTSNGTETVPDGFCPSIYTLSQCFDAHLPLYMGDDPVKLDFNEFIDLLFDISADLHQSN